MTEFSESLFKKPCVFIKSVAHIDDLPDDNLPEVALAGRSNVGKSSLINALFNNRNIARTSNTPGRTQLLNFFEVGKTFNLVDMPGYGYAEAPKQIVRNWQELIRLYIFNRTNLKRIYVLIDARHGFKPVDLEFMAMLDSGGVSYQIIVTKSDKISSTSSVLESIELELKKHGAAHPIILLTSSEKRLGLSEVRLEMTQLCS